MTERAAGNRLPFFMTFCFSYSKRKLYFFRIIFFTEIFKKIDYGNHQ